MPIRQYRPGEGIGTGIQRASPFSEAHSVPEYAASFVVPYPEQQHFAFDPSIVDLTEELAKSLSWTFGQDDKAFPHAKMHIAHLPHIQRPDLLTFQVAWGRKTELAIPRKYMIPHYYGLRRVLSFGSTPRQKITLDGYGFIGVVTPDTGNPEIPNLRIFMGNRSTPMEVGYSHPDTLPVNTDAIAADILTRVEVAGPLRLRDGVSWIPRNGTIWPARVHGRLGSDEEVVIPYM